MKFITTAQVVLRIAVIIALAELLIMLVLAVLPHHFDPYTEAVIDTIALILLAAPPIFIWVIKPFVDARDAALAQISRLAHLDPLTQLANRRLLSKHLEKTIGSINRHRIYGALLLLDLDEFKSINDTHGHDAGDAVLVAVANCMQSVTRTEDVLGRLGGDEFIVLISGLGADRNVARTKVSHIAEKLITCAAIPVEHKGKRLQIHISIGIRILGPEKLSVETAIRDADTAMYRAKKAGGKRIAFFED